MAKGNRRFGPADRAVVIAALLDGATVAAAARAAGFVVQTLYDDRKRCPLFARAWADAVAESGRSRLVERGTGGWWTIKRLRRNRFTRARKDVFLGHLMVSADVHASAVAAGVCTSTVYNHRESDPAFAEGWVRALAAGVAVQEARLLEERFAARAAFDAEPAAVAASPAGRLERDLEFWRCLHLLRAHKNGFACRPVRQGGIRPRIRSQAEASADTHRALAAFAGRARAAGYRL